MQTHTSECPLRLACCIQQQCKYWRGGECVQVCTHAGFHYQSRTMVVCPVAEKPICYYSACEFYDQKTKECFHALAPVSRREDRHQWLQGAYKELFDLDSLVVYKQRYTNHKFLYFLFDDDELVYVGQTQTHPLARCKQHEKEKVFNGLYFLEVGQQVDLVELEHVLIQYYTPKYNEMP